MEHKEFAFNAFKTDFYGQYWQPKKPKGIIVLLHGMGEHSGRYIHVVKKLVGHDFMVVCYDNFGHGKTSGKRGHNPSFESLLEVIDVVIEKAKQLLPNAPVFLYGHSMGGNLVMNYVLKKEHTIKGVIASSPFLKLAFEPPIWKINLGKLMQKIAPSITLGNELNPKDVSRDPKEVQKYINDPLVHDRISANYSLTIIDTGQWVINNAKKLKTPMFLAHGKDDKIIACEGSISVAEQSAFASLKLYKNGYHELHNDTCKELFLKDIITWLNTQMRT